MTAKVAIERVIEGAQMSGTPLDHDVGFYARNGRFVLENGSGRPALIVRVRANKKLTRTGRSGRELDAVFERNYYEREEITGDGSGLLRRQWGNER